MSSGHVITDVSGLLTTAVGVSAAASFDPDNLVLTPYAPGLGITAYDWRYLLAPPGCAPLPTPPAGATASTFVLYAPGSTVPPLCQGSYLLGVAVTDDEVPPNELTNFVSVPLSIGNCPSAICIDYPTTRNFKYLQSSSNADALIYYHLNAALYAEPAAGQALLPSIGRSRLTLSSAGPTRPSRTERCCAARLPSAC